MAKLIDLTGQRFGRLTVVSRAENGKNKKPRWLCKCDCGNSSVISGDSLRTGHTQSCGCVFTRGGEVKVKLNHGSSKTRLYRIWCGMKKRVNNKNVKEYKSYGERGIIICEEWENNYPAFQKWALSNGYANNLSIDRIDTNKGYSPENCRWADDKTQNNNKRTNHYITYHGEKKTISEWESKLNMKTGSLKARIIKLGWSIEKAIETPVKRK